MVYYKNKSQNSPWLNFENDNIIWTLFFFLNNASSLACYSSSESDALHTYNFFILHLKEAWDTDISTNFIVENQLDFQLIQLIVV